MRTSPSAPGWQQIPFTSEGPVQRGAEGPGVTPARGRATWGPGPSDCRAWAPNRSATGPNVVYLGRSTFNSVPEGGDGGVIAEVPRGAEGKGPCPLRVPIQHCRGQREMQP